MDLFKLRDLLLDFWELYCLLVIVQRNTASFVGELSLFKHGVVEPAAHAQCPFNLPDLLFRWFQPEFVGSHHRDQLFVRSFSYIIRDSIYGILPAFSELTRRTLEQ